MNFGVSQAEDETGIELTPLIDVVFLLLIFFMISTTFTKETTLQINLPESSGEPVVSEPRTVEVHISAMSEYAIAADGEATARTLVNSNRATLVNAMSEFSDHENMPLVIRADRKATHDAVIKVLDVAQQLGMTNITFATKQISQ